MKAVILAAGRGTRLGPLAKDRPKCMTELRGKTLLSHQLDTYRQCGISDVTVVAGYKAEAVKATGVPIIMNPDFAKTNMVASLFCARALMTGADDLIVSYGDIVFEERVLAALIACADPVCVTIDRKWRRYWEIRMDDPLGDAETLKMDGTGRILELGRKPGGYADIEGQYMGLFKVRADHVARLTRIYDDLYSHGTTDCDGRRVENMYMTSFLRHLIDLGWRVQAVPVDGGWLEVDTAQDIETYRRMALDGSLDSFYAANPADA